MSERQLPVGRGFPDADLRYRTRIGLIELGNRTWGTEKKELRKDGATSGDNFFAEMVFRCNDDAPSMQPQRGGNLARSVAPADTTGHAKPDKR